MLVRASSSIGASASALMAWLAVVFLAGASELPAAGELPPQPAPNEFLHDLAGVLNEEDAERLRAMQAATFASQDIPIVVVTIQRITDFDPNAGSIENLARRWFDHWGIGSPQRNHGMLVLVSIEDRAARIELGAAWGRLADGATAGIMDRSMVPEFRNGNYGAGLRRGVEELQKLAQLGPKGVGAASRGGGTASDEAYSVALNNLKNSNPLVENFGPWGLTLALLAGLGCIVAAVWLPEHRKALLLTGLGIIVVALFFWIFIVALAALGGRSGRSGSRGGFSGGFSGGGGASGRW